MNIFFKLLIIVILASSGVATLHAQPVITSFSPTSGPVGTIVTITGNNFDSAPSNNIVWFGGVRANVISSTSTSLNVVVPAGCVNEFIKVTRNGLTVYSRNAFSITFKTAGITSFSFEGVVDSTLNHIPSRVQTGDFNLDGWPDVVICNFFDSSISIYLNNKLSSNISLAPKIDFKVANRPSYLDVADIDGDGWLDIIVGSTIGNSVILKNLASSAGVTFSNYFTFPISSTGRLKVRDFNDDGRPDIALVGTGALYLFQNDSQNGNLSFFNVANPSLPPNSSDIAVGDLNDDGKSDIAITTIDGVYIFKNTSSTALLSFATAYFYQSGGTNSISLADFNGDGKNDIACTLTTTNYALILKNTSTSGALSFLSSGSYNAGSISGTLAISDIDGDGKPDLVMPLGAARKLAVLRNISSVNTISFAPKVEYAAGAAPFHIAIDDFTLNGTPDLIITNNGIKVIALLNNRGSEFLKICRGESTTISSNITGSTYQWQVSTDSLNYNNITNTAEYSGTTTQNLRLMNIPSGWNLRRFRCVVGASFSDIIILKITNSWKGGTNTAWENSANWSCGIVPDANTDVVITSGTIVINSNVTINSLTLSPGVIFTVNPGYTLTILH